MAYKVEIDKTGYKDISNHIDAIGEVPYIKRNRDWATIADEVKLSISYETSYTPLKNDAIKISSDSTILFMGTVEKVANSEDTQTYICVVRNQLLMLDDYLVEYDQLHSYIADTEDIFEYEPSAPFTNYPTVQVLWLMQKTFESVGLTLDVSLVEDVVAFSREFQDGGGSGVPETKDVEYKRITMDENMLYCINQNIAALHGTIDGSGSNYNQQKITLWILIREICSAFKFSLMISGADTYQLNFATTNYTIGDDDKYSYVTEDVEGKYADASISYSGLTRGYYNTSDADAISLKRFDGYGSSNAISWYNNLEFFFNYYYLNEWFVAGEVELVLNVTEETTTLNPLQAKADKLLNDYTNEDIITTVDLTQKSINKNLIDIGNQVSKIEQES